MDINLTAPINALGYGVVGLNTALALNKCHTPALWFIGAIDAPAEHHQSLVQMRSRTESYNPKAPSLRIYHQFDLAQHVGKGLHAAMPIFELTQFRPVEKHHLLSQDLVFANSAWAGVILQDNGVPSERIRYANLGVDTKIFAADPYDLKPAGERTVVGNPTVFLNCGKWEYRKGHDVLLEAFCKAFTPNDNVKLVMNCFNPCLGSPEQIRRYNDSWVRAYLSSRMGSKIQVIPNRLPTQADVARLMRTADCGVFPSRAEGWGLESAEMLAMGKHVILTNYSAPTQYANRANSLLIEVDSLEDAHDGQWFDATKWEGRAGQWAMLGERQVDQLVAHMRDIHKRKQEGSLEANHAGLESMRDFTWDTTAAEIALGLSA